MNTGKWGKIILFLALFSAVIAIIAYLVLSNNSPTFRNSDIGTIFLWVRNISGFIAIGTVILGFIDWITGSEEDGSTVSGSRPIEEFSKAEYELLDEQMNRLNGWFDIVDGDIRLSPSESIGLDREMMLYVLACWVASENEDRDSDVVAKGEIKKELGWTDGQVDVFMRDTSEDDFVEVVEYSSEEIEKDGEIYEVGKSPERIKVNPRKGEEIVDWVLGEGPSPG